MAEAIRKALYSSLKFSFGQYFRRGHDLVSADDDLRVGEYRVDCKMPPREELQTPDPALEELFANSKTISVKK